MTDAMDAQFDVLPLNPELARRATLTVCDRAANPTEAQEFLQMLGLVETPPAQPKPVPTKFRPFCLKCDHPIARGRGVPPHGYKRHAAGNVCSTCYDRERKQRQGR